MMRSDARRWAALLGTAVALGGCDAIFAEPDPPPPVPAATVAPMPSPSEIVVPAPPLPELPPEPASADAGLEAGADAANAWPVPGGSLDNASMKKALYGKVASGRASIDEIRMLKAACNQLGDKACRDMANEALKKKFAE